MRVGLVVAALALLVPAPAVAGGPRMLVGAAEDSPKQATLPAAQAEIMLLRLAGLNSVRMTARWEPGQTELPTAEREALRNAVAAANLGSVRVFLAVHPRGSSVTPLTAEARHEFATFCASIAHELPEIEDFIVGNEPNLNRYWLPQYGPEGENVAASAFLLLLEQTYDAIKAEQPDSRVWGLGLSPRGSDDAWRPRQTHSPITFLRDLGTAYRESGRDDPIMDGLAIHPYPENSSIEPRKNAHPTTNSVGIPDYEKLVDTLEQAFDGTAQPASDLPIIYAEFGVESRIPSGKADLYTGTEPETTKPVSEQTQARFYEQALALSFCQPNVEGLFFFHTVDEVARTSWQSGLYYADGTAKASRGRLKTAVGLLRRGVISRCDGLELRPRLTGLDPKNSGRAVAKLPPAIRLRCDLDCSFRFELRRSGGGGGGKGAQKPLFTVTGRARAGRWARTKLPSRKLAAGTYRLLLQITAPLNPGEPLEVVASRLRVPRGQ